MRISGGGNFLSPRNEGLENGTAKPCHSEARSAVRIALPQPLADMNFSEGSIQTITTMRSLRRFAPQDDMSEVESNKNLSLAPRERVSAGQERGQLQDMTEITLTRKSSFRETLKQIFNPLPEVEGKCAFTLAEVLITLGIIGIVAALTLPAFISNVQGRIQTKRVENINQKLSKVTDKMAVQSGLIGYPDTMAFVQEMKKHMSIAKVCDNSHLSECWGTTEVDVGKDKPWEISKTKTAKNLKIGEPDNWADTVGIVTADGTPMILSYDKECNFDPNNKGLQYNQSSGKSNSLVCLSGVFDWNGGAKPNKLGDDVKLLGFAKGLGSSCAFEVNGTCYTAPFTPTPLTRAECEAQKSALGIKECCTADECNTSDYWAGAVKQCGGVSKLPTEAQLAELASQLYVGNPTQFDSNSSTAKALGLTPWFYLWSGEESSSSGALYRGFGTTSSYRHDAYGHSRKLSDHQAVCIGD